MDDEYWIYVGIDWATEAHQACVLDCTGRVLAERSFAHTGEAIAAFAQWCEARGIRELATVEPSHIAAFIKKLQHQFTPPTVKQHLAALRMLFDWLVLGHVIDVNPAHAVRGPRYVVRKGKTSVLTGKEARELLDSIPLVRNTERRRKHEHETES